MNTTPRAASTALAVVALLSLCRARRVTLARSGLPSSFGLARTPFSVAQSVRAHSPRSMTYIDSAGNVQQGARPPPPQCDRTRVLYAVAAAALVVSVAWSALDARRHAAAAADATRTPSAARATAPADYARALSAPGFAHDYSRVKPNVKAPSFWDLGARSLLAHGIGPGDAAAMDVRVSGRAWEEALFGEDMGDEMHDSGKGGTTRCAQGAYAATSFFCGAAVAAHVHGDAGAGGWRRGVSGLHATLDAALALGSALVLEVQVHDDLDAHFGHVFSLRVDPAARGVVPVMSFIREYTLATYISRHPTPLVGAALRAWLGRLRVPEASGGRAWGPAAAAAYEELFDVDMSRKTRDKTGDIAVIWAAMCVVPPWDGTAANVGDEAHAGNVRALLEEDV